MALQKTLRIVASIMLPTLHRGKTWQRSQHPSKSASDIIKKVNYDTAAAKLAIDWVGDSYLKSELFADSFDRVYTESEIVSKTRKAIQEATEALALFDTGAEQGS